MTAFARRRLAAVAGIIMLAMYSAAAAQDFKRPSSNAPFLLSADRIVYDYNSETISAEGQVEITSEERILRADRITYNRPRSLVTASGNIVLLEPTGEIIFGEYLELDSKLKTGFIDSLKILLADDSRFAANKALRPTQNRIEMSKAVYSPCKICIENPDRPLLWQIKADRIIHLRDQQEIVYHDAVLEVFGVPIAYTPYFSHADPTVRRKSGFLTPRFGSSSDLGATLQVPYFWAIDERRDLTLEPIFSSEAGLIMAGEYRAATEKGGYEISGSATYADKRNDEDARVGGQEFRGHVFGNELFSRGVASIFGKRFSDILSGYRVFSRRFVKSFPVFAQGFEIDDLPSSLGQGPGRRRRQLDPEVPGYGNSPEPWYGHLSLRHVQ